MIRRLLNLAAALSLLLFVATAVFWARGYRHTERVDWLGARGFGAVSTGPGEVSLQMTVADWSSQAPRFHGPRYTRERAGGTFNSLLLMCHEAGQTYSEWAGWGFNWSQINRPRSGVRHVHAAAPMWGLAAVTGLLPVGATALGAWGRLRKTGRERRTRCVTCGYDLRATPDRCPECGRATRPVAVTASRSH